MSTREEHLEWCKNRALQYVDAGQLTEAFASFASDVKEHEETSGITTSLALLGMPLMMNGHLDTRDKMRSHIQGYA